jgi:hypothetical protein
MHFCLVSSQLFRARLCRNRKEGEQSLIRPGAAPVPEQLAILILVPPIMAALVWIMSRGWAATVQGGVVSERTKRRQKIEFWALLIAMYLIGFGMFVYASLT